MEVLQETLISSQYSDDTEGSLLPVGTESKGRKTGFGAIRMHQKHRPSLQRRCSAINENKPPQWRPRASPSGRHAVGFGEQHIYNVMLWGQETKEEDRVDANALRQDSGQYSEETRWNSRQPLAFSWPRSG